MQRKYNPAHFILTNIVFSSLTVLMVGIDAHAQIAFVSNRAGDHIIYKIYVMDANGKNLRRLTDNHHSELEPSWSPGGKRIAFVSGRDRNLEIYVMDTNGRNQRNLSNNPVNDRHPSWSPDGKHIAFTSSGDRKIADLHANWQIYVMDTDGGNRRNLTKNASRDENPSWSPDGKRIAFDSYRDGNHEIYVMDTDGKNQRNLTNNPSKDRDPSWSPDGKRIAFSSNRARKKPEIYVMDADGGNPRNLTQNPHDDTDPAWYDPAFAVAPVGKQFTVWGWLKQVAR